MSSSNCCILTRTQVSQETGKMVWYSHLIKNFPQFVTIHMVNGFSVVNETEIDVFLKFPCFLYNPANVGNLIFSVSSFLNPTCTSRSSWIEQCWSQASKILSMTLLAWEMSATVWWLAHSLVLPLGIEMRIDLFQFCSHCWFFQICWHIECNTLMASPFWVLNSSTGIPTHYLSC